MKNKKFLLFLIFLLFVLFILNCGFIFGFGNQPVNSKINRPIDIVTIAHRGVPTLHPENTIVSYEKAIQHGADYIEIDVQMTNDGVLVALHDETVDRTTNGTGKVSEYSYNELTVLTTFSNTSPVMDDNVHLNFIPSLEEIFLHFGKSARYYIEIKSPELYPGIEIKLLNLLEKYQLINSSSEDTIPRVVIQSFSASSLQKIHEMDPSIALLQLYKGHTYPKFTKEKLKELKSYVYGVGLPIRALSIKDIEKLRSEQLKVHVYTINDPFIMKYLIEIGVNGIITDAIYLLNEVKGQFYHDTFN